MKKYAHMVLLVLLLAAGCQQGVDEPKQQAQQPAALETATGYLPVFGKDYGQHQISNRMRTNIKRLENSAGDSKFHDFRSAGLSVYLPKNMEPADRFTGFTGASANSESTAVVIILTNPFSMEQTTEQIVSGVVRKNSKILFTDRINIDGREGVLYITREQLMGVGIGKYIAAFGDDDFSWIVTATFTLEQEDDFGEELLKALVNIKISDSRLPPGEDVDFTMDPDKLVLTSGFVDKLLFTLTGKFRVDSVKEPIFQASRSMVAAKISEENKLTMSRSLIPPAPDFEIKLISSEKPVTIDGMDGYEFISIGRDRISDEPLVIYSVVVYSELDTYLMHGWASSDNEENYIDVFRRIANSLKRKQMAEKGDEPSTDVSTPETTEMNEADGVDSSAEKDGTKLDEPMEGGSAGGETAEDSSPNESLSSN